MPQGQYDNTNRGAIYVNDRKQQQNHPDRTGTLNVEGVEYFINGWIKTAGPNSQNPGQQFMSLSVKRKDQQHGQGGGQRSGQQNQGQQQGNYNPNQCPF